MAKPQKKKVRFLMMRLAIIVVMLFMFYVMFISLIEVSPDMDPLLAMFIEGARASKLELINNFEFYILMISISTAIVVPIVLKIKKKN